MAVTNLLRQPLLHFLLLGALIFAFHQWRVGDAVVEGAATHRIVVSRQALLDFMQYRAQAFVPDGFAAALDALSADEREALIAEYVREEALYREARGLGLEQGDYDIRLRLVQKAEFLLENLASARPEPDDATLEAYFMARRDDYRSAASYTFTHIFFDALDDGMDVARARAEQLLAESADIAYTDAEAYGDPYPFLRNYESRSRDFVANNFGQEFMMALDALNPDAAWQGPIASRYGQHLVLLRQRKAPRVPEFSEVRARVLADYRDEAARRAREQAEQDLVARYEVVREL
jgi:parvulin-like peptidyl-prolyl isomerase